MSKNNFETERLVLRKLRKEDVDLIVELNSDPEVMRYIGDPDPSCENARKYVAMRVDGYADKDGLGIFIANIKTTRKAIGWFCLKYIDGTEEVEVGFRLLKKYWNQGFATEGASCLIDFGFKELGLHEIVAIVMPENEASQQVLKKMGLEDKGMTQHYGLDLKYFKITNAIE